MRCPHCGATVKIRGRQWECGFCGDFGVLTASQLSQPFNHVQQEKPETISVSFPLSYNVNLPETWKEMKSTLRNILSEPSDQLITKLGATVIYEICHALSDPKRKLSDEKKRKLELFLKYTPDLGAVPSVSTIVTASKLPISQHEIEVYITIGQLSKSVCGCFWQELIRLLPSEDDPDQIGDLFLHLGHIYQYFASDSCDDLDSERQSELEEAFEYHWNHHRYLPPM